MTDLINDDGVCRTDPATPGLLKNCYPHSFQILGPELESPFQNPEGYHARYEWTNGRTDRGTEMLVSNIE